jgi:predicted acylesterase/phospholipase RssA
MQHETKYYTSCRGVFQGGGCRAVALAGAYDSAHAAGVRFSEVAGTSAGSIIAALIGAGASPTQLYGAMKELDYDAFLVPPKPLDFKKTFKIKALAAASRILYKNASTFLTEGGMYSSAHVESWLEGHLRKLLPDVKGKVTFADLPIPTHIVAGDVVDRRKKVWSTAKTPTDSVAFAARASCSIPVFFQPAQEGRILYVDGGIISNLPLFVFADSADHHRNRSERILAFALVTGDAPTTPQNSIEFLLSLSNLSVDGATDLQQSLQPKVSVIEINTGSIRATDFNKMNDLIVTELINEGKSQTERFLKEEHHRTTGSNIANAEFRDEHQAYFALVSNAPSVKTEVIFAHESTNWFWELFPTIMAWRRKGINVVCLTTPCLGTSDPAKREAQRREMLSGMGVHVVVVDVLPVKGILADTRTPADAFGIVYSEHDSDFTPHSIFYRGRQHSTVLRGLDSLCRSYCEIPAQAGAAPTIDQIDEQEVTALLSNNIPLYRPENVRLTVETVQLDSILLLSRHVRAFRLRQLPDLNAALSAAKIDFYQPAQMSLVDGRRSIITPPVFEESGGKFVAIEGNTRTFYAFQNGAETITGIVVRGVSEPLPGVPIPLKQVRITEHKLPPEARINGFDHSLFRHIERAVRPLE